MLKAVEEPKWLNHNIEAEQGVLGAILINNEAFGPVGRILRPHDFFEPIHAEIFEAMGQLIDHGKRADAVTLKSLFVDAKISGQVTIAKYLGLLMAAATTVVNAPDYARVVRELSDRRALADVAVVLTPNSGVPAAELATEAIAALDGILEAHSNQHAPTVDMRAAVVRAVDAAAQAYQHDGIPGIPTGLRDLDAKMGGLSRGDLVVMAGRPGMGKSAMLLTVLRLMAMRGLRSKLFSLEMGDVAMTQRMISDALFEGGRVPYKSLRSGEFHERVMDRIVDVARELAELPISIDQTPGLTIGQIAARARQMKRRQGLDVLAIDHLGLIRPSDRYRGNKVNEIAEITGAGKMLAKELDCVVIMLSQLSRKVEEREDKRPVMADLRDSGSIEQDADSIVMLYRPTYYLEQREPEVGTEEHVKWQDAMTAALNKLQVIVSKHRNGSVGAIDLFCDIGCNAVRDLGARGYLP